MNKLIFLCLFALICSIHCEEETTETSDVHDLTTSSFSDLVNTKEVVLVEFYAPWCGHCKKLEPVYKEAATSLKEDTNIALAKVDATVEKGLATTYGVTGFPTMILFKNGKSSKKYEGDRSVASIVSYLRKQAGPAAKVVEDSTELNALTDVAAVGYFKSNRTKLYKSYLASADALRDHFAFYLVESAQVAKQLKLSEGVSLLSASTEKPIAFGGASTARSISEWVWEHSVPTVALYNQQNKIRYDRTGLPLLKLYVQKQFLDTQSEEFSKVLERVASDPSVAGVLSYVFLPLEDNHADHSEYGLKTDAKAQAVIVNSEASQKFVLEGEPTFENLLSFADRFASKSLVPHVKSEPIPETQGDVKVVVGNNFNDIVMDSTKNVLLEIYAPWCGHCKRLEPTWNELAASLKNVENVVIAKLDGTANDVPSSVFKASGFPTILFVPADNKVKPIPYEGAREIADFTKFLKEKSKTWVEKPESASKDEL